jgi:hypothetical protein
MTGRDLDEKKHSAFHLCAYGHAPVDKNQMIHHQDGSMAVVRMYIRGAGTFMAFDPDHTATYQSHPSRRRSALPSLLPYWMLLECERACVCVAAHLRTERAADGCSLTQTEVCR